MSLSIIPITFDEACEFVRQYHRHHIPPVGSKFQIAIAENDQVRGVAIVGRPVARNLDDGWTLEVTRCCTDGVKDGCSKLYGAARRATFALGYRKLVTYTLAEEGGGSLRGAGWKCIGSAGGGSWHTPNSGRPRVDKHPTQTKLRWEVEA